MKNPVSLLKKYKVFDLMNEGIQILDKDWNYVYINKAAAAQGKSSIEQLLKTSLVKEYPGVEKTEMFAVLQHCMSERSSRKFQNEFDYPDGSKGWFELSISPVEEGILILSLDISEALYNHKFKEHYNDMVLDSNRFSEIGYWELNTASQQLYVSDNWLNIFGVSRSEFEGSPDLFFRLIHPDDLAHFQEKIGLAFEQKKNVPIDFRIVRHDNKETRYVQAVGQFQFDAAGEIVRDIGFIQDITSNALANEAQKKVSSQLDAILEQTFDNIFSINLNYEIVDINHAAIQTFKKLTGRNITTGFNLINEFPPAYAKKWKPHFDRALSGEQFRIQEKSVLSDKDFYAESNFNPIWNGKEVVGVSIFSKDITFAILAKDKLIFQENAFRRIISETGELSGQAYFEKTVLLMADIFDADYCMIGKKIKDDHMATIALCTDGKIQDALNYELKQTPCETAISKNICVVTRDVADLYPQDMMLVDMQAQAYVGVPLVDKKKNSLGIFNIVFKKPLQDTQFIVSVLEMLAINISIELQRIDYETELIHAKEYVENLLNTTSGIVVILDKATNIKMINKAGLHLSEYNWEELKGKNWFETLVPANQFPEVVEVFNRAAHLNLPEKHENPIITKSGKQVVIDWQNSEIVENGEVTGTLSVGVDITHRKMHDKILSIAMQDRDNFRDALNNSALVSITDLHGKIIYANDKFVEISKFRKEELIGQDHRILSSRTHDKSFWKGMWTALHEGKPWRKEVKNKAKDGSFYWVDTTVNAVCDEDGEVYQYMSVRYDITEKKQGEQELIDSESNLKAIFENSAENILSLDAEYKTLAFNERAKIYFKKNYGKELIKGVNILDLLPVENRDSARMLCDRCLSGEHFLNEREFKRGSTSLFMETSYSPIHTNGQIVGLTLSSRDITDKKSHEETMQKMDKLNSLGTLAGGIAHDFNNILLGISANISMLKLNLPQDSQELEYINESVVAMKRASALTKQLLTFSKGGEPIKELVDLTALIEDVVKFDLSGSNVKPQFIFPTKPWPAMIDKGQIQQVISNLTINADQAMPNGGILRIQVEKLKLSQNQIPNLAAGNYLRIKVTDTGSGIEADDLDQIFDPYFSTKKLGHGLGLATSYSIIKKHKGDVSVASEAGKGSTFTLHLPAIPDTSLMPIEIGKVLSKPVKHSGKILIMDDIAMLRKVMSSILKEEGYQVMAVEDGQKAIDLYHQHFQNGTPFDAVILDMTVPGGKGGVEALEEILKSDPHARVIASSGYSNHSAMSDHKRFGFKDIIIKPYTNDELLEVLNQVLSVRD